MKGLELWRVWICDMTGAVEGLGAGKELELYRDLSCEGT